MEIDWLTLAAGAALASLAPVLGRLRRGLRGTSLQAAWHWAALVWLDWLCAIALTIPRSPLSAWADVFWYLSGVLALTPPIAVLGARRPTSRVWTWFVLVPLVLVFTWPIVPVLGHHRGPAAFSLEEPVVVGYVLVVMMGAGNYLGLRFSSSALLWMAGLLLVVLPLCPATTGWVPAAPSARAWGTMCLVAAAWIADRQAARSATGGNTSRLTLDRLWGDFRDLFGIVWARRLQERFNDDAHRQGLKLRLGMHGLEDAAGLPAAREGDPASLAAAEASLRWLLQKFVDSEWIERRL